MPTLAMAESSSVYGGGDSFYWTTGQWRSMLGSGTRFWGSCSGTDKVIGINNSGQIVCAEDIGGAGAWATAETRGAMSDNPFTWITSGGQTSHDAWTTLGALSDRPTFEWITASYQTWNTVQMWSTSRFQPSGNYTTIGSTIWLTVGAAVQSSGNYTTIGSQIWTTTGHGHTGMATEAWTTTWVNATFQPSGNYTTVGNTQPQGNYTTIGSQIWLTVGHHPAWATTMHWVTTTGNATWTTMGHGHSYQATGSYTTIGSTDWYTAAKQAGLGMVKGGGTWTTCGGAGADFKMVGFAADGTMLCASDLGGAPDPAQFTRWTSLGMSSGLTLTAQGWLTSGNFPVAGNYTTVGQSGVWLTTGQAATKLTSAHCTQCHATRNLRATIPNAVYTWYSNGTLAITEYAWGTFNQNITGVPLSSMDIRMRGTVWTTKGGCGIIRFGLHYSTLGSGVATSPLVGWVTVSPAAIARVLTAYDIDCMVQWNSIATAVTASASCRGILGGTIGGSSWSTFTMDTTLGGKVIFSVLTSAWTTNVGANMSIGAGQFNLQKGSEVN